MMKKSELRIKLLQLNIRKDSYCLDGGLPNEAYCLEEKNGVWQTYYSERGSKTRIKVFSTEEEACEYFYNLMIR